jgi:predicted metal-dependent HD superfamily phosphohydrolase
MNELIIKDHWYELIKPYCTDGDLIDKCFEEILKKYSSYTRHYHDLEHIEALLNFSEEYAHKLQETEIVELAIFYHDIVYSAVKSDNEEKSAEQSEKRLMQLKYPEKKIELISKYIIATKTHDVANIENKSDLEYFLDFDMAILGAEEKVYIEYCEKIREEYSVYPDFMYNKGRKKVLISFLEKPTLFHTEDFRTRFEAQAIQNIRKELAKYT